MEYPTFSDLKGWTNFILFKQIVFLELDVKMLYNANYSSSDE